MSSSSAGRTRLDDARPLEDHCLRKHAGFMRMLDVKSCPFKFCVLVAPVPHLSAMSIGALAR